MAKIGKGALENLTHALYTDSRIIFREYIQNSSDQIDVAKAGNSFLGEKLEILIHINSKKRFISIKDTANGIPAGEVKRRLEVIADSEKVQGENKGFRGIGRLGGIAYCDELRFVTTAKGEKTETTMIWNAKRLQEIFADHNNHSSAEAILDEIISYECKEVDADEHYFEVQLIDIRPEEEKLLDYRNVKQYISEVAPVDFKETFIFKSKIDEFIAAHKNVPPMCVYNIGIRRDDGDLTYIYKDYQTCIYKMQGNKRVKVDTVRDIYADVIYDSQGKEIAWIWYALSSFKGAINDLGNPWKGLRLRQFNIQIGENNALAKFFKEARGNSYFMGEVHTLSKELRPNARRDYFNDNLTVREFEQAITEYFKKLARLYKMGSDLNSSYDKLDKVKRLHKEYEKKLENGFATPEIQTKERAELEKAIEQAKESVKTIRKYNNQAHEDQNSAVAKVVSVIDKEHKIAVENVNIEDIPEVPSGRRKSAGSKGKSNKPKLLVEELSSLNKKERKLISKIYDIIQNNLPSVDAEALIGNIHKELKSL